MTEKDLNLETGFLCLDFANTVGWHASDSPAESLKTYHDLVVWANGVGLLDVSSAEHLGRAANRLTLEASRVLERAIDLRETIYRIFSSIAHQDSPAPDDLDRLNATVPEVWKHQILVNTEAGFVWTWTDAKDDLEQMLWPIARSAIDLLTSPAKLDRVSECADDRGCGYLFWDSSRNRSRKWCEMGSCGNRAKARRHYQRARAAGNAQGA